MQLFSFSLGMALISGFPVLAHEYWIASDDYTVSPGKTISARLMVGQMMQGEELPWLSQRNRSFRYFAPNGPQDVASREGNRPAVVYTADEPGLHIIAQETMPLEVVFDTMTAFREYLEYEGLGRFVIAHGKRGLPDSGFSEAYSRSAKMLVQVGPVQSDDHDRALGLKYEIIALENPYAGQPVLPIKLLWQGLPEADAQISVFRDMDGQVERTLISTDADGRADIPLHQGGGVYLVNAVHLEPVFGAGAVWESTWASLTFEAAAR